jgi:uncharacterized integral membrane protein
MADARLGPFDRVATIVTWLATVLLFAFGIASASGIVSIFEQFWLTSALGFVVGTTTGVRHLKRLALEGV